MLVAALGIFTLLLQPRTAPSAVPDFFVGRWSAKTTGPTSVEVSREGDRIVVTIQGQPEPLDGRLYVDNRVRPPVPFAILAQSANRLFVLRKDGDEMLLEIFSTLPRRPPSFWSDRYRKAR